MIKKRICEICGVPLFNRLKSARFCKKCAIDRAKLQRQSAQERYKEKKIKFKKPEKQVFLRITRLIILSNEERFKVLISLFTLGPHTETDFVRKLNLRPSTIAYHLSILQHAGLVRHHAYLYGNKVYITNYAKNILRAFGMPKK